MERMITIKKRKRWVNSTFRRHTKDALNPTHLSDDTIESIENGVREVKRKNWRKYPDQPLGEVVKKKLSKKLNK